MGRRGGSKRAETESEYWIRKNAGHEDKGLTQREYEGWFAGRSPLTHERDDAGGEGGGEREGQGTVRPAPR